MRWDAKTITAWAALVAAVSGAVELRVQVGMVRAEVAAMKSDIDSLRREAHSVASIEP